MPLLSPAAVDAYLARPWKDFSAYKRLSDGRLNRLAAKYGIDPVFWQKLRRHQRAMLLVCLRTERFALWADTGTGKTVTMLALAQHHQQSMRMLVLVPRKANKTEWQLEISKHAPGLSCLVLPSKSEEKIALLSNSKATVVIETYAGLFQLTCSKVKGKRGKNKLKPDAKKLRWLAQQFNGLVLDESHHAKTWGKLPFRICRYLSKHARYVFALSGTPHGRDPSDLWGQMIMVDNGETLGETLGLFRSVFFSERKAFWGGPTYEFNKRKTKLLNQILNNRSIRFEAKETDLPPLVPIIKTFSLPEDAETYYQRARETLQQSVGNYNEQNNAWLRMRQISSGFLGFKDGETNDRNIFEFPDNPKLDLLLSLAESLHDKAIIFYEYTYSGLRIARELKKLGIEALHLYGGSKNQDTIRKQFAEDERCRVLILQNQFGEGLNLQAAKFGIFYESPVSPIVRKQCQRRFERQGSTHDKVFQYDLVCRDTVDEQILAMLKEGRDLFREIIDGKSRAI